MDFAITLHSGSAAPPDAIDLLWAALGSTRDGARFTRRGAEITARWEADAPVSMERDEREDIGRRAILSLVRDVCEGGPGLKSDWYAIAASH